MRTKRELAFEILGIVKRDGRVHRRNLIGGGYHPGTLFGTTPPEGEIDLAYQIFDELVRDGLLGGPRTDLTAPDEWVVLSESGNAALNRQELDEVDTKLGELAPHLIEIREGMHRALASSHADSGRQAAHSARELLSQILPSPIDNSDSRKARIKRFLVSRGVNSDGEVDLVESVAATVTTLHNRLSAEAHRRGSEKDIADLIEQTEFCLRRLLT